MSPRIVLVGQPVRRVGFERIDSGTTVVVLGSGALSVADDALCEAVARRHGLLLVAGGGERWSGHALAIGLASDWLAIAAAATLDFAPRPGIGRVAAALARRIGPRAQSLLMVEPREVTAAMALEAGIVDALVPEGRNPLEWSLEWIGGRSVPALVSAAALIRRRGCDPVERAEFSRLFAAGEPRKGLGRFLAKVNNDFRDDVTVETI